MCKIHEVLKSSTTRKGKTNQPEARRGQHGGSCLIQSPLGRNRQDLRPEDGDQAIKSREPERTMSEAVPKEMRQFSQKLRLLRMNLKSQSETGDQAIFMSFSHKKFELTDELIYLVRNRSRRTCSDSMMGCAAAREASENTPGVNHSCTENMCPNGAERKATRIKF